MDDVTRRDALKLIAAGTTAAATGCSKPSRPEGSMPVTQKVKTEVNAVLGIHPLGSPPWRTRDPFLFCVHHDDKYPAGNEHMAPPPEMLVGRNIGQDFEGRDGWRMYHGDDVPGFPQHPHRGFETVTVVRRGLLDHADSLGAAARYGQGDTQWLTAGKGILHAEMFPLIHRTQPNPLEFFQIWLNLPRAKKLVEPYFTLLWNNTIPTHVARDDAGRTTEITVVAGQLGDAKAPPPPPNSWASQTDTDVAIWTLTLAPFAKWTLPAAASGVNRTLYFFRGSALRITGHPIGASQSVDLRPDVDALIENGPDKAELLMLQGRPIQEPVVHYGPFVMNTREEIQQTFHEYQRTRFGGWPWPKNDPVHPRAEGRFARFIDGRIERPA